jgi:hypothetical protein
MKLTVLAVRDRAVDAFGQPIFVAAAGQGIRGFHDEINRAATDNTMFAHPEDYDLYELGTWENDTGLFTQHEQPRMIAVGKDQKTRA